MDIIIKLKKIEFSKTLSHFIPELVKALGDTQSENLLFRAIGRLNDTAERILLGTLNELPECCLQECFQSLMSIFENPIVDKVNEVLKNENSITSEFKIGGFDLEKTFENGTTLVLKNVYVDYSGLLKQQIIQEKLQPFMEKIWEDLSQAAGENLNLPFGGNLSRFLGLGKILFKDMGKKVATWSGIISLIAHYPIDSVCVRILEIPEVKSSLQKKIQEGMKDAGIFLEIEELKFSSDTDKNIKGKQKEMIELKSLLQEDILSKECQQQLVDGIVFFLSKNWK